MEMPGAGDHHAILRESLGIAIIPHRVMAKRPLPEPPCRVDLVTGFRIQFDLSGKANRRWNADEWSYFLDDLKANYLTDRARVAIYPRLSDPERVAMFERRGGRLVNEKRKLVVFDPLL